MKKKLTKIIACSLIAFATYAYGTRNLVDTGCYDSLRKESNKVLGEWFLPEVKEDLKKIPVCEAKIPQKGASGMASFSGLSSFENGIGFRQKIVYDCSSPYKNDSIDERLPGWSLILHEYVHQAYAKGLIKREEFEELWNGIKENGEEQCINVDYLIEGTKIDSSEENLWIERIAYFASQNAYYVKNPSWFVDKDNNPMVSKFPLEKINFVYRKVLKPWRYVKKE